MNIQITNIPNGQKIKNISFNISFEDETEISKNQLVLGVLGVPDVPNSPNVHSPKDCTTMYCTTPKIDTNQNTTSTENIVMPEIDISNRVAKIPDEMLGETF